MQVRRRRRRRYIYIYLDKKVLNEAKKICDFLKKFVDYNDRLTTEQRKRLLNSGKAPLTFCVEILPALLSLSVIKKEKKKEDDNNVGERLEEEGE